MFYLLLTPTETLLESLRAKDINVVPVMKGSEVSGYGVVFTQGEKDKVDSQILETYHEVLTT